jgi:arylsulfatase A-like enzyme
LAKQPNILFIMADDHASKAISAYGWGINKTPNIDRVGNEGIRLNNCYVTNSICTPSRAAILAGTYNHVNCVTTLSTPMNNRMPNVAKHLQTGGYQTAIVGKWHLGEGKSHEPTGFDYWSVLPGQGDYFDPHFIEMGKELEAPGYATDIITEKSLDWLSRRDTEKPFFLMCHHKAPHREWEPHPKYRELFHSDIEVPSTFDDDYKNRAKAAAEAKMRIKDDMTYDDLGLVQPEGGSEIGVRTRPKSFKRKIPNPFNVKDIVLIDKHTGEKFTFETQKEFHHFKYQRYMKRYLATIASIDDSVGQLLDYLDENHLTENTIVIYTSDQGFFLGEHGWFDKRFIYEESFQMPFLCRYPVEIEVGQVSDDICCNVDFAPTFLDFAGLKIPSYMQGKSLKPLLKGQVPENWSQVAYHRYWMHKDPDHNAYSHYGVRDQSYKLVYWYNEGFNLPGTNHGGEDREWELFDCKKDPMELFNEIDNPKYANVKKKMLELLNEKMAEIGDEPVHVLP